jgi:hypothetical protein
MPMPVPITAPAFAAPVNASWESIAALDPVHTAKIINALNAQKAKIAILPKTPRLAFRKIDPHDGHDIAELLTPCPHAGQLSIISFRAT